MEDYSFFISSFVSYRRNIKDMPFVKRLSDTELAIGVSRSLSEIFVDSIIFKSLKNLSLFDCLKLKEELLISGQAIDNKDISAYGTGDDNSKIVLINEEDHIKLIAKKSGLGLEECFKLANDMDDQVLEKLEVCFDNNLGYLTSNPKMIGTGMEVGVLMFIPAIVKNKVYKKIQKELLGEEFLFLDYNLGEWNERTPFVMIKNRYTFGHKENEFAEKLYKIALKIKEIEIQEENKVFDFSSSGLVDLVFRNYGIACNSYRITFEEAEEKIANILWGIRLKMLKCKKNINLFDFLSQLKDNHLGENLDIKEKEKRRAKTLCEFVSQNISKGEVDV